MVEVEVLFFGGCPNHRPTVELARELIAESGVRAELLEIEVGDQDEAERLGFLGSPSVRVNGIDIEPDARGRTNYAVSCRMYGTSGVPPRELLAAALAGDHG